MTLWKLFCLLRNKQYCSACVAVRQLLDWQYSSRLRSRSEKIVLCYAYIYSSKHIFGLCIILSCISSKKCLNLFWRIVSLYK